MDSPDDLHKWLCRGNQRLAVATSLRGVMTGTQLWRAAAKQAPRIQLRDTRAILRQLEARGVVCCLNPAAPCGRLFAPTRGGHAALLRLNPGVEVSAELPVGIDPTLLSFVLRGAVRHAVFRAVTCDVPGRKPPRTATTVKRYLRETCPVTLNQAIRALHELEGAGLVASVGPRSWVHVYVPTEIGLSLAAHVSRVGRPAPLSKRGFPSS